MSEDTIGPIDPKPSKLDQVKSIIRENQTPLAAGFAAGFAFVIGRKIGLAKLDQVEFSKACLKGEYDEIALENFVLWEFLDAKNLRDKYSNFAKELYEKEAAAA